MWGTGASTAWIPQISSWEEQVHSVIKSWKGSVYRPDLSWVSGLSKSWKMKKTNGNILATEISKASINEVIEIKWSRFSKNTETKSVKYSLQITSLSKLKVNNYGLTAKADWHVHVKRVYSNHD